MNNLMTIGGQQAVISFDPDINMFRGEFVGLTNGGADFYAEDVNGLLREAKAGDNEDEERGSFLCLRLIIDGSWKSR